MRLVVQGVGFMQEVTEYVGEVTWSGNYRQCARTLAFTLLSSADDPHLQRVKCELGNQVLFYEQDKLLFDGYVFRREKSTDRNVMEVTCLDRGVYLNQNQAVYRFVNQTAAEITRQVCREYGIKVGELPEPGRAITRNFLGSTLYDIIQTAYTLAAQETKKKYFIVFDGDTLTVQQEATGDPLVLAGGSNLMTADITESIENMVNQVNIYDKQDNLIRSMREESSVSLYGLMQRYLKQQDDEDASEEAQKILEDNGVSQKITVECLGNTGCVTGQTVMMQEPYTGLYGVFWIENDTHTWKLGQYYNKLTLNFRRMMDEVQAGSEGK